MQTHTTHAMHTCTDAGSAQGTPPLGGTKQPQQTMHSCTYCRRCPYTHASPKQQQGAPGANARPRQLPWSSCSPARSAQTHAFLDADSARGHWQPPPARPALSWAMGCCHTLPPPGFCCTPAPCPAPAPPCTAPALPLHLAQALELAAAPAAEAAGGAVQYKQSPHCTSCAAAAETNGPPRPGTLHPRLLKGSGFCADVSCGSALLLLQMCLTPLDPNHRCCGAGGPSHPSHFSITCRRGLRHRCCFARWTAAQRSRPAGG
jgi:hypothetical protein